MSAFRGILTGYGMAAIKNKEAKDNAKMEIVKSAGIDFLENKIPQHEKEMKLYDSDYKAVELIHGTDIANLFGDAEAGFYGTGKGLQLVNQVLEKNNISKDKIKNFKFSTQDERIAKKKSAFQSKKDQVLNLTGIGGIGTETAKNQLEGFGKDDSMMDTQTQVTDQSQTTDTTTQDTEEAPKLKTDISSLFTPKPDVQGVEAKYNNISKAVNEQMQYGSPIYNAADQTTTFNISDQFRSKSQAHIQIASAMTANDNTINQLDVVSRSKQELDNQTVIPFKVIAMSLGNNTEYREGHGKANAMLSGLKSRTIDSANTTVKRQVKNPETNKIEMQDTGVSIFQYLTDVYNNDLLKDGQSGKVNSLVFKKFLENIPPTIMYGDQSLKSVIAQAHESSFFKL